MAESTTERVAMRAGIWDADAPDGYVALVVMGMNGRRLLRIEIVRDMYEPSWLVWLDRWLRRWDSGYLRIVR